MSINLRFIPEKYIKRREKRVRKLLMAVILLFIVFDGYIAINLKAKLKRINSLDNEITSMESMAPAVQAEPDKKPIENKMDSIDLYDNLVSIFNENAILKKINLSGTDVTIEATIEGKENYIKLLKKIEDNKQWSIDSINTPSFKENTINLNLHMKKVEKK